MTFAIFLVALVAFLLLVAWLGRTPARSTVGTGRQPSPDEASTAPPAKRLKFTGTSGTQGGGGA